ncbi:MAG: DUF3102 domain-containing protein [Clostridia bacterium]|nr:DUF3102 domain-containing protein [Clostridia bacterium]
MENTVVETRQLAPGRDIGVITSEIHELCRQAQATALAYIVEIGRRLVEAKAALDHGEWGGWLKEEVGFSQSTANNYMKLFEEYGDRQMTIFGAVVNSQTLGNLPYSKALALLAVPASEREEFAKEVGAEELSVKELERVIKERDAERERARELEARVREADAARAEAEQAGGKAEELRLRCEELEKTLKDCEGELAEANDKATQLKAKLDRARSDPKIPKDKLETIKKEAAEEAKKALTEGSEKELQEAREALKAAETAQLEAERKKAEAEAKLHEAEARLKTAAPEVNAFKVMFDALQSQAAKCKGQIEKIRQSDPETAEKLAGAMRAFGGTL